MRINLLWPSDTICWHKSGSTLVKITACRLPAPSHYLNQCWLIINETRWHLAAGNCAEIIIAITQYKWFQSYKFENTATSHRGRWANNHWILQALQKNLYVLTRYNTNHKDVLVNQHQISFMHILRERFVYAPSQWETTLQCNVVSHWLGAYTEWSLYANLHPPLVTVLFSDPHMKGIWPWLVDLYGQLEKHRSHNLLETAVEKRRKQKYINYPHMTGLMKCA